MLLVMARRKNGAGVGVMEAAPVAEGRKETWKLGFAKETINTACFFSSFSSASHRRQLNPAKAIPPTGNPERMDVVPWHGLLPTQHSSSAFILGFAGRLHVGEIFERSRHVVRSLRRSAAAWSKVHAPRILSASPDEKEAHRQPREHSKFSIHGDRCALFPRRHKMVVATSLPHRVPR
ncbi:hypothetical protein DM02DRAFT_209563 [Periconia macrospinosa]|uniref:Uncharacterized protein n=1 Tax=Periconia macrospinosa TaxID=97972 RepID=A0A2V1D798_9PLEO|nr:hypothetical protein DM02DRAFT_209563 [Periconia macrospinosa]